MFNKLPCRYNFILQYKAWVNAIRASSFIENFPQISAKPIAFQRNLLGKLSQNPLFFTNLFSAKLASKITMKFPRNRPFFPRMCPWKSREVWLFSRDLPEALHTKRISCVETPQWLSLINRSEKLTAILWEACYSSPWVCSFIYASFESTPIRWGFKNMVCVWLIENESSRISVYSTF